MSTDDDAIRAGLTGLVDDVDGGDHVWDAVVGRRRRRRIRRGALAGLPVLLLVAVTVVWVGGHSDRDEVIAGPTFEIPDDGWVDFEPFAMTYRTQPHGPDGPAFEWRLDYQSAREWTQELLDPERHEDLIPTAREELAAGVQTAYAADGSVQYTEPVPGRLVPLGLLSKGPWGGARDQLDLDNTLVRSHVECVDDEDPMLRRTCAEGEAGVTIEERTTFNDDGVPILAEERVVETGVVRYRFELLTYQRHLETNPAVPAPGEWQRDALGGGGWSGARTSPDGRTLVVVFTGGRPFDADDPCSVEYRGVAIETQDRVAVEIESRNPLPPPGTGNVCTAEGYSRTISIDLDEPLGERIVVEAEFNRVQGVFDGSRLVEPTWLPEGWTFGAEGSAQPSSSDGWRRDWGGPEPEPSDSRCTPSDAAIALIQTSRQFTEERPTSGEMAASTHDVNGAEATYFVGGTIGVEYLSWSVGDEGFILQSVVGCAGDDPAPLDRLLRFARGLEAPG